MDVEITRKNGDSFRLSDIDVQARDFIVSSIEVVPRYGSIEGRHGKIDYGANFGDRTITVPFFARAKDTMDYPLLRDELFALTTSKESFYIRELRRDLDENSCENESSDDFVGGKRYLVRLVDNYSLEQQFLYGFGELVFETTALPFSESIGTSMDIHNNGINADDSMWGYGMGLLDYDTEGYEALQYVFEVDDSNYFRVYNPSNIPVLHPFECDFKIKITNIGNNDGRFRLRNQTNQSVIHFEDTFNNTDEVIFDGPNVSKNGLAYLRNTNKEFIWLSPGWNRFQLYYTESATIEFDFRFYYL